MEADDAGLDLTVEVPDAPLRAWADPNGLQVVLKNLLSNAVKFTDEGGTVWAWVEEESDRVVVMIEDTGIGMDPEEVPALFRAFKQASEGIGREYEGTGLGLAVAKEAVDQMGGSIEVATEKDEGTRFTVCLPKADAAGPESS
jgi:signal transduction histidine kinase